jgi:hypothetical protein
MTDPFYVVIVPLQGGDGEPSIRPPIPSLKKALEKQLRGPEAGVVGRIEGFWPGLVDVLRVRRYSFFFRPVASTKHAGHWRHIMGKPNRSRRHQPIAQGPNRLHGGRTGLS